MVSNINNTSVVSRCERFFCPERTNIREYRHNFVRDFIWTIVSALNLNVSGMTMRLPDPSLRVWTQLTSNSFVQTMGAQWLYGSAPMLVLAVGEGIHRQCRGQKVSCILLLAPPVAASLAIPMWDIGQVIGTSLALNSPCFQDSALWYGSSIAAGMVAAPFTGMLEGFTQWGVRYSCDLLSNNNDIRSKWCNHPCQMAKLLLRDFFLNITIGAIPGAVWQTVYFFMLPALRSLDDTPDGSIGWSILLTGLFVSSFVMMSNHFCAQGIKASSACIEQCTGWEAETEALCDLGSFYFPVNSFDEGSDSDSETSMKTIPLNSPNALMNSQTDNDID